MTTARRQFLISVPAVLAAAAVLPRTAAAKDPTSPDPWPGFPRQHPDLAREIVGAAHRDEGRVRELLTLRPALANAWWDWGFGDWESPLGAAAHTGRRSIAELLLASGARFDIFAAAMLGHLDAVRALIAASPGIERTHGPHGITLLAHAKAGGEQAAAVVEYLSTLPGADVSNPNLETTEGERAALEGTYTFGPGETDGLVIAQSRSQLTIQRPPQSAIMLRRTGDRVFSPAGARDVSIRFDGDTLVVVDGDCTVRCVRTR